MRRSPYFDGVSQSRITIAAQQFRLPLFYYDGRALSALFPARLGALRRAVPDPALVPARLAPGVGLVGVTAFEHKDTDIGPYNEVAISVILKDPDSIGNLPGQAIATSLRRRRFHAYVHHLPVTTEVARVGGVDLYNFPKFIAAIDFTDEQRSVACRLAEGEEHILTLRGPRVPARRSEEARFFSHLWMDRQPQSAEFRLNVQAFGLAPPGAARLELGERHPIALELSRLLLSRRSLQYQLTERFEGILYGPERLSLPLLERMREALSAGEPAHAS